ncbi:hypothetical protein [Sphingomicrobium lutaoense]|uniref:Uncharacterized protein n=1 Tax=Sphingomicrobium lutaoense TaxID=515949 RepID=A0A839Z3H2_9SPHN|nr:hypothetical protein [Sphingomicrobium lutaoense]MBB3764363.1 hypothetical protein [Sphingomicrobium lutaoense]
MRGFGPILWACGVAFAALSCYLVSLQVASERAQLEDVEREILAVTREIRELETEIGTRGRLAQLEQWNVRFLQLSAPRAGQFLDGSFQLATLTRPEEKPVVEAPVILAAAPAEESVSREDLLVQASLPAPVEPKRAKKIAPAPVQVSAADPLAPLPAREQASNAGREDERSPMAFISTKESSPAR